MTLSAEKTANPCDTVTLSPNSLTSQETPQTSPPAPGHDPGLEGPRGPGKASAAPPSSEPPLRAGGAIRQEGEEAARIAQEDPPTSTPLPEYNPGWKGFEGL